MFCEFFNFKENPFSETPDSHYFFRATHQCNVLSRLASILDQGQGFAVLTGEVGLGKTFLARTLLLLSERSAQTALLLFSALEDQDLLASVVEEFGISVEPNASMKSMLKSLSEFLIQTAEDGQTAVLVIDEAQNLTTSGLEVIRMLSNVEQDSRKLLQIVLVGQPELNSKLQDQSLRQLNQRIGIRLQLKPFLDFETAKYIQHRVEIAGGSNFIRWTPEALKLIHKLSGGVPRLINLQGQLVVDGASRKKTRIIDEATVRQALMEANILRIEKSFPFRKTERLVQR
ncbi:MAG: AAA family ATPase [Bdellovibrionales bacterium]|nr:AAA family ATPase [Bdellovibrionales bacterium]